MTEEEQILKQLQVIVEMLDKIGQMVVVTTVLFAVWFLLWCVESGKRNRRENAQR